VLIRIVAVDRVRSPYVAEACADLRKRLSVYHSYAEIEVRPGDGKDPRAAMHDESARITRQLRADDRVWLLERSGTQLTSPALASRLEEVGRDGTQRLTLVIAGTYGADSALRMRAEFLWSLSELTFLHEWARMIVLEQLYRAAKIVRNEPYHR
jgi:23S rRNA (pseudouridine1915-N3)-methyltransferase